MRGKALPSARLMIRPRITPAYAGKSRLIHKKATVTWDHPRLCGEKSSHTQQQRYPRGSPPPMRGKACHKRKFRRGNRITPAYAGKRLLRCWNAPQKWDHPRLCGEKTKKIPKQRYFFHQPASFSFSLQYT